MSHDHKFPGGVPPIKTDGHFNHPDIAAAFEHSLEEQARRNAEAAAIEAAKPPEAPVELHSALHRRDPHIEVDPTADKHGDLRAAWIRNHPEDAPVKPRSIKPEDIKGEPGQGPAIG